MILRELIPIINSKEETVRFAKQRNLIKNLRFCVKCHKAMTFSSWDNQDGYVWRCNRRTCRKVVSIRLASFFKDSRISLGEIIYIMYLWSRDFTIKQARFETKLSKTTLVDWYRFCRDIAYSHFESCDEQTMIGGESRIVEIDESLLTRRKYHRGREVDQVWMFGGIDRDSSGFDFFVEIVPDRSKETLLEVINRRIRKGTTIISDQWASYRCLSDNGYRHQTVNHSENFVNPENPQVHTQTIESRWWAIKRQVKRKGTNLSAHIDEYLLEYMYRKKFKNTDLFDQFILDINKKYPL